MACLVNRSAEGRVISVKQANGKNSELYDSIRENVFIPEGETALDIYKSALTPEVQEKFEGKEPTLMYRGGSGKVTDSLTELLIEIDSGTVQMGFFDEANNDFMPIASFETEGSGYSQYLSGAIKNGFLSDKRKVMPDGKTKFQGKGSYTATQNLMAMFASMELRGMLGEGRYKLDPTDGTIEIEFNKELTRLRKPDGTEKAIKITDIPQHLKENPNTVNKVDLAFEYINKVDRVREIDKKVSGEKATRTPSQIEKSLTQMLKSLGFTTTTLEKYRKNYNTKYGQDPDIDAIADITNRVVALAEDGNHSENITEEMAHIALEMYADQSSIAGALAVVHKSAEYSQFAEIYREKYSPFFEGVALEDQVRKEVLGKALKRAIQEKFNTENKSQEEADLFGRLRDIWNKVVKFLTDRIKPSHMRIMDRLNEDIADSIFKQETDKFTNELTDGESFFYNLLDKDFKKVQNQILVAKRIINDQYQNVLKQANPHKAEIEALEDAQNENEIVSALNTVVGTTASQLTFVESNITSAKKTGEVLSQKAINTAHVLDGALVPMVNEIRNTLSKMELDNKVNKDRVEQLFKVVDELNTRLAAVKPELKRDNDKYVDNATKKVIDLFDLDGKELKDFLEAVDGGFRDASFMGKMFGLASHSRNPMIALIGQKVEEISHKVRRRFNERMNTELNDIDSKNLWKHEGSIVKKGSHYYKSFIDFGAYETALEKQENELVSKLTDKSVEEVEKLRKGKGKAAGLSPRDIINNDQKYTEYRDQMKAWKDSNIERRFTDAYYEKRAERFETANVSKETESYMSRKSSNMARITQTYQNPDGTIDKSKMSDIDKVMLKDIDQAHKQTKSPFDANGNVKNGLQLVSIKNATQEQLDKLPFELDPEYTGDILILERNTTLDDISVESRMALDLFNLDMLYRKELKEQSKTRNPLEKFGKTIEEIEKEGGNAYEWAAANSTFGLSSDFYNDLGQGEGFMDVAEAYVSSLSGAEAATKRNLLDELSRLQSLKRDIIKQNRSSENMLEIDVFHMTVHTRARLLELDENISEVRRELAIPKVEQEKAGVVETEGVLNDDFQKMLDDSDLSAYEFSLKHMTDRNAVKVRSFGIAIKDIVKGSATHVKSYHAKFLNELAESGKLTPGMTNDELIQIAKDEYAKQFVASYFKRFQPQGYSESMADLKSGKISMQDFLNNKDKVVEEHPALKYVEITPDYTWTEDSNNQEFINKNFKEGVPFTPKLDKYLDKEFFSEFGIKEEDYRNLEEDDLSLLKPTKNKEQYDLLTKMVKLREDSSKLYGDQAVVNKYLRPQLSSEFLEKVASPGKLLSSSANRADAFTDLFRSKEDEKEHGEIIGDSHGSNIDVKIIPKFYQSKIGDPSILTDNIIYAALMDHKEAIRYTERVSAERELSAFKDKIDNQDLIQAGSSLKRGRIRKKDGVSAYSEKAQEMLDHSLYGIRQARQMNMNIAGREIDLTQVFNRYTGFVRFTNLGFNPIVDATSYTTGVVNNLLDRISGDFYSAEANKKATRQLPMMAAKYVAESGKIKKDSELGHMLEFFGLVNASDRLQFSNSNRIVRGLSKSAYGMSKIANMGVTPKVMLAIMHDTKFIEGKFRSYNNFKKIKKRENKSIKEAELKAIWNKNNDSLYENITIDKTKGVQFNEKFVEKYGNEAEAKFQEITAAASNKIAQVVQSVDSMTSESDQTMAQRDALSNAFLMHRSWLLINLTRRLKGKHFNIATGQMDEGHYRKVISRGYTALKNRYNRLKGNTDAIVEMEQLDKRTSKRLWAEFGVTAVLALLTRAMLEGDDDDDSSSIEAFAQLIALRTTSETQSSNFWGLTVSAADVYETPLIQVNNAKKFIEAAEKAGKGDFGSAVSTAAKSTPLKRSQQLGDLQTMVSSFRYFNGKTLIGVPGEDE